LAGRFDSARGYRISIVRKRNPAGPGRGWKPLRRASASVRVRSFPRRVWTRAVNRL
jgi:hypothetical protein